MEIYRLEKPTNTAIGMAPRANGDSQRTSAPGRSLFPSDSVAHIYKPSRSAMTSGKARTKGWRLVFERRSAPYIEPLMGWTGNDDTLSQVELSFPTLKAAIAYAERQGLSYAVEGNGRRSDDRGRRQFSDATLNRLGLGGLRDSYRRAMSQGTQSSVSSSADTYAAAMKIVNDPDLSLEDKRSLLMNWAWHEYLNEQAIGEGMPESGRPANLHEVELALLALENAAGPMATPTEPSKQRAA